MDKYCTECGEAIDESLNFCQNCGHKLHASSEQDGNTVIPPKKQPKNYTKKQKIIMGAVAALLVFMIGGYTWGKSYFSPEKTAERFITAIIEEDYGKVQDLTMMQGESISQAEAEALVTLAKEEAHYINIETTNLEDFTNQNDLMKLTDNGKHLFIFPKYQFSLVPQYADLDLPFKDIETTFNEETFPAKKNDERNIVYGPLAPGKYKINSSYSGELTEAESDDVIILGDSYSDTVYHDVQLNAESTTFHLYNSNDSPIKNAYIEVNEQQIPFDESMNIDAFGPLNLDGSVTATPIIETEWGKVTLEDIKIEEDYYELTLNTVSKELMDNLSEVILLYGEEYVEAHAANDATIYTAVTENLRENFQDDFSYNIDYGKNFTGQLDKIEINYDELTFYEKNEVAIPANFHFTASTHDSDEQPDLEERIDTVTLLMVFDPDEEKWLIDEASSYGLFSSNDFKATATLEGSQELHKATKSASAPASKDSDEQIEETTLNYIYSLVEAINAGDYELVRPYIKDDSPLHGMQVDLVNRLVEKGMKQEVIDATVTNIEEDGDSWIVTTDETIKIIYSSGKEETSDYSWNYTVESDGNGVSLTNID
ncbi:MULTISPECIES: zinc ribbon domain-containing protein [unclassified Oceanobacillus]|uniref:zinc ribbon domain-containing protein n=1 Tax=unclassified Oceanobacillus TaxID=2630292 RepID=UPI00300DE432